MMTHIQLKQGDDYTSTLTMTADGVAVDITGATVVWHLRLLGATTDALAVTLVPLIAASGTATLTLTDTQTAALVPTSAYSYELECTDVLGNISTPVYGRVYVTPDRG